MSHATINKIAGAALAFVLGFLAVAMLSQLAHAERADPSGACITRGVFERALTSKRHPFFFAFPPDLSRSFVTAWNEGVRGGLKVPATTDGVFLYDTPKTTYYRLAFFKGDCLVDAFDVPEDDFWKVIGEASGPGRVKI